MPSLSNRSERSETIFITCFELVAFFNQKYDIGDRENKPELDVTGPLKNCKLVHAPNIFSITQARDNTKAAADGRCVTRSYDCCVVALHGVVKLYEALLLFESHKMLQSTSNFSAYVSRK